MRSFQGHYAVIMREAGHDAVHTLDLPRQNRTPDSQITAVADAGGRVVVTKDDDFAISHILYNRPGKLLMVRTSNIRNGELSNLFAQQLSAIEAAFGRADYLEMTTRLLIIHMAF